MTGMESEREDAMGGENNCKSYNVWKMQLLHALSQTKKRFRFPYLSLPANKVVCSLRLHNLYRRLHVDMLRNNHFSFILIISVLE